MSGRVPCRFSISSFEKAELRRIAISRGVTSGFLVGEVISKFLEENKK